MGATVESGTRYRGALEVPQGTERTLRLAQPQRIEANTVRQALESVFASLPELRGYVLDDQGAVRTHIVVYVNEQPIRDRIKQSDEVDENDRIGVFQALSGG